MLKVFAFSIFFLCGSVYASEPPAPTPSKPIAKPQSNSSKTNNNSQTNNQSSVSEIPTIKIIPASPLQIESSKKEEDRHGYTSAEWWAVYITSALAIITLALAIYTGLLWSSTKKLVSDSQTALISTQRAFIFIKLFELNQIENTLKVTVVPVWENSGDTPTKNMISHVNGKWFDSVLDEDFTFPDYEGEEIVRLLIGPKQTMGASPLGFSESDVRKVINGNGHIYVWGWAEYSDIFEKTPRHRTEFCSDVILYMTKDSQIIPRFKLHKKYNGADNECMKKPSEYTG